CPNLGRTLLGRNTRAATGTQRISWASVPLAKRQGNLRRRSQPFHRPYAVSEVSRPPGSCPLKLPLLRGSRISFSTNRSTLAISGGVFACYFQHGRRNWRQ